MGTTTGTTSGVTTTASIYMTCSGTYCGHDIDEVFEGSLIPASN